MTTLWAQAMGTRHSSTAGHLAGGGFHAPAYLKGPAPGGESGRVAFFRVAVSEVPTTSKRKPDEPKPTKTENRHASCDAFDNSPSSIVRTNRSGGVTFPHLGFGQPMLHHWSDSLKHNRRTIQSLYLRVNLRVRGCVYCSLR